MVDTNVLLNLATPVVDGRAKALTGADPFKALLASYDVHIPESVLGEVAQATGHDDLLSAAAELVLQAAHHLTTHDVAEQLEPPLDYGLDREESECVWLANELNAGLLITDEFNTTNYLFISLALEDRNTLFTTPHILWILAKHEVVPEGYVESALSYYVETKNWDNGYVALLRRHYLGG